MAKKLLLLLLFASAALAQKPVEKPKEVNLFDFGDDEPAPAAPAAPAAVKQDLFGGDGELTMPLENRS